MDKKKVGVVALIIAMLVAFGLIATLFASLSELQRRTQVLEDRTHDLENGIQSLETVVETRTPRKGYVSISPPAFSPVAEYQSFDRTGYHFNGGGPYFANLQLPQNSIITNMTVYLNDTSQTLAMNASLLRYDTAHAGDYEYLARVTTLPPERTTSYTALSCNVTRVQVDNQRYTYYIELEFQTESPLLTFHAVVVEYEYPL